MAKIKSYLEWTIEPDDESEPFDVWVEYNVTPGRPAKLNALPEDCYPAEAPEVEFVSVKAGEQLQEIELTDEQMKKIELHIMENPPEDDREWDWCR